MTSVWIYKPPVHGFCIQITSVWIYKPPVHGFCIQIRIRNVPNLCFSHWYSDSCSWSFQIFFPTEILPFWLLARKGTYPYKVLLTFVAPLYCSADKPHHLISFTAHTCGEPDVWLGPWSVPVAILQQIPTAKEKMNQYIKDQVTCHSISNLRKKGHSGLIISF